MGPNKATRAPAVSDRALGAAGLKVDETAAGAGRRHIFDYCLGEPQQLASSHSGAIDMAVSLQEEAVFLPARVQGANRRQDRERSQPVNVPRGRRSSQTGRPSSIGSPGQLTNVLSRTFSRGAPEPALPESIPADPQPASDEETPHYDASIDVSGTSASLFGGTPGEPGAVGAVLRGSVILKLTKPTRIKELSLDFYGVSRTFWSLVPQPTVLIDAPLPSSAEIEDVVYFGHHHWDFMPMDHFGATSASYSRSSEGLSSVCCASDLYGATTAIFRDAPTKVHHAKRSEFLYSDTCKRTSPGSQGGPQLAVFTPLGTPVRKLKTGSNSPDGVMYPAGEYVYHFAVMVDSNCPETVVEPNGKLVYVLVPRVVRAGAFAPNLSGHLNINVIRSPPSDVETIHSQPIQLSRIWDDRLVYSVSLAERYVTLDVPSSLRVSLMPLPGGNVMVHQVRVYILEMVAYTYSPDPTIRTSDSSLRLVVYQRNAPIDIVSGERVVGNLLHPTEPTQLGCEVLVSTTSDRAIQEVPQAYGRGRLGEKRFAQPDVTSDYVRVRHRLIVTFRVSKKDAGDTKRHHFEVKIDTPVILLSKLCVDDNINLPVYDNDISVPDPEGPPSFDDALSHQLVSPPGNNPPGDRKSAFQQVPSSSDGPTTSAPLSDPNQPASDQEQSARMYESLDPVSPSQEDAGGD